MSLRRIFSILGAGIALTVWVILTTHHGNPVDAWDFWVDPARPFATEDIHHYLYSPALAMILGITLAIAAASFVINPAAWGGDIQTLAQANPTPGWPFPWPIWVRLVVALSLVMLLGLLPLLPNSEFARRLQARRPAPRARSGWPLVGCPDPGLMS